MEKLFGKMSDVLERIKTEGRLLPIRIEPPARPGAKDLGEVSDDLKRLYTLVEVLLKEIEEAKKSLPGIKEDILWLTGGNKAKELEASAKRSLLAELELQREIAARLFSLRFHQCYGWSDSISLYGDWHAWEVPLVFGQD